MHRLHVYSPKMPKKLDARETPETFREYLVGDYARETL